MANKNKKTKERIIKPQTIEIPISRNTLLEFGKSLAEMVSGKKVSLIFPKSLPALEGDTVEINLVGTVKGDFLFRFLIIKEEMNWNENLEMLKKYRKIKK